MPPDPPSFACLRTLLPPNSDQKLAGPHVYCFLRAWQKDCPIPLFPVMNHEILTCNLHMKNMKFSTQIW